MECGILYAVRFSTDNIISLFHISQFALLKNHIMNAYEVVWIKYANSMWLVAKHSLRAPPIEKELKIAIMSDWALPHPTSKRSIAVLPTFFYKNVIITHWIWSAILGIVGNTCIFDQPYLIFQSWFFIRGGTSNMSDMPNPTFERF